MTKSVIEWATNDLNCDITTMGWLNVWSDPKNAIFSDDLDCDIRHSVYNGFCWFQQVMNHKRLPPEVLRKLPDIGLIDKGTKIKCE